MVLRYANTLVWVCVLARCILERSLLSGESDERFSVHFIVTVLCRVCVCERERGVPLGCACGAGSLSWTVCLVRMESRAGRRDDGRVSR